MRPLYYMAHTLVGKDMIMAKSHLMMKIIEILCLYLLYYARVSSDSRRNTLWYCNSNHFLWRHQLFLQQTMLDHKFKLNYYRFQRNIIECMSLIDSFLGFVDKETIHRVSAHIIHDGIIQLVGLFSVGLHDILWINEWVSEWVSE